jgi:hypothetical protein
MFLGVFTIMIIIIIIIIIIGCRSHLFIVRLSFGSKRRLAVKGLRGSRDIAISTLHRCLYAMDQINDHGNLFVIDPSNGSLVCRWVVDGTPANLAVASLTGNVIVASAKAVREYTRDGQLVRTVPLSKDMTMTWQAVPMANNNFIVCQVRKPYCLKSYSFCLLIGKNLL